jgi:hypothetical protein
MISNNSYEQPEDSGDFSPTEPGRSQGRRGGSVDYTRRSRLKHMVMLPLFFTVLFVFLVIVAHDWFTKKEYITNMEKVGLQVSEFQKSHNRLPSSMEFLGFNLQARSLQLNDIVYGRDLVAEGAAGDTVLAHSPCANLRLLADGHTVLYLDGRVEWVSPQVMGQLLTRRQQFYNSMKVKPQ